MKQTDIMVSSDVLEPARSGPGTSVDTSRAIAVDRVVRGGVLALLGAGIALLPDALNWSGLPLLVTSGAGIVGLAAGAV